MSTGVGCVSYAIAGIRPRMIPLTSTTSTTQRAIYADAGNADLLRQYETYALEYDKRNQHFDEESKRFPRGIATSPNEFSSF
jgi:hypothetical protein